jgi:hypothetical protein
MVINKQLQESHEVLQVPTMPSNAWYLGLVLFILGSWLAIVVDVFILLDSRVMAVNGEVAVLLSRWCWLGKCSLVSLLASHHITSHGCEVFRGIAEECHWWHTCLANLINTSQATKYLVLGDGKSASPERNKVKFLTEPLVSSKGKYLLMSFFLCS